MQRRRLVGILYMYESVGPRGRAAPQLAPAGVYILVGALPEASGVGELQHDGALAPVVL
jgi:hypothetical protein